MMYLPLDKIMEGSRSRAQDASNGDADINTLTDRVVEELRARQGNRREGR